MSAKTLFFRTFLMRTLSSEPLEIRIYCHAKVTWVFGSHTNSKHLQQFAAMHH